MARGQRQVGGDERRRAQIAAGGLQLANRVPRALLRTAHRFTVIVTEKQRLNIFGAQSVIIGMCAQR